VQQRVEQLWCKRHSLATAQKASSAHFKTKVAELIVGRGRGVHEWQRVAKSSFITFQLFLRTFMPAQEEYRLTAGEHPEIREQRGLYDLEKRELAEGMCDGSGSFGVIGDTR
jgi:hypothetical protein